MRRWTRRLTLVALSALAVAAAGLSSAHASCPDLDVTCQVGQAVDPPERLLRDIIGPVDTPVSDTLDPVIDTVDPVVDDVLAQVDDLLGGGQVDPPIPGGGGGGSGGHVGGPPGGGSPSGDEPRGIGNPDRDGRRDTLGPRADGPGLSGIPVSSLEDPSSATRGLRPEPTSGGRFGAAVRGVARSLAIVLALFGLAVAFVAIQDRLDRSDPRLALAPVESDVVEFA